MSLLKTYLVVYKHSDTREIDHHKRRARSLKQLKLDMIQEFGDPNEIADHWYIEGRYRKEMRRPISWVNTALFESGGVRGGQYVYRHKGRKLRGRKHYPQRKYSRVSSPVAFTYTESYATPVRQFLQGWAELLLTPQITR